MTRVKLCGTTRIEDLEAAVAAGADAVGVITGVPVETPRAVSPARAADLLARVPPLVTGVLVTMPDGPTEAADLVERTRPDALQVHGQSPDEVRSLAAAVDVPLLVAVDVEDDVAAYAGPADALLLDSTDEHGAGGTGTIHDWDRASELAAGFDVPVVLAGGLTSENVAEAVDRVDPFAVDVASGVERTGGIKDHDAMRRFTAAATGGEGDG